MIGIYCIKNKINGKCYVGQSSNVYQRIKNHFKEPYGDTYFDRAKKKYGQNNFEWFILAECEDKETAKSVEDRFINMFKDYCGVYNSARGGQGGDTYFSKTQDEMEEIRKKISISNHLNNGNKGQYIGNKNAMYGKKWFTNGLYDIVAEEAPEGFYRGKTGNIKRDITLDIEVLDGGDWTKVISFVKNDKKNVIGWLKFVFENGKEWLATYDHPFLIIGKGRVFAENVKIGDRVYDENNNEIEIIDIEESDYIGDSYDLETESDTFDISGIRSHNCRSRVQANKLGPETSYNRGNCSFTTINLPRLAILSENKENKIDNFFKLLDKYLLMVEEQLLDRLNFQMSKKPEEFKFMWRNKIWLGKQENDIDFRNIVKHGTLGIGYIGLSEALYLLTGKHHGEDNESQKLGIKIIKHIRDFTNKKSEEHNLNFSTFATPAEGLSGRFTRADKEEFGVIKNVTDKDYYTNSNHVDVSYEISPWDKIDKEVPYHELANGGNISYVEFDSSVKNNLLAVEQVVRYAMNKGIIYFSINYPMPICSSCGRIADGDYCPEHGTDIEIEYLARITGYLSNSTKKWVPSKQAEYNNRIKHLGKK